MPYHIFRRRRDLFCKLLPMLILHDVATAQPPEIVLSAFRAQIPPRKILNHLGFVRQIRKM